mmetsp:Transcript_37344/g.96909  ORF Transcript_37344/g.96909 Transcript_37344/m.96909 type:complete len:256 (-) Transcript_37344:55-822(-)
MAFQPRYCLPARWSRRRASLSVELMKTPQISQTVIVRSGSVAARCLASFCLLKTSACWLNTCAPSTSPSSPSCSAFSSASFILVSSSSSATLSSALSGRGWLSFSARSLARWILRSISLVSRSSSASVSCSYGYRHRSFSSRASHCAFTPSSPCTSHLHTPRSLRVFLKSEYGHRPHRSCLQTSSSSKRRSRLLRFSSGTSRSFPISSSRRARVMSMATGGWTAGVAVGNTSVSKGAVCARGCGVVRQWTAEPAR